MRNHYLPCDKQGNKGVRAAGEGSRVILLQHYLHLPPGKSTEQKNQNQPVILRLVMLSLKFKRTLGNGDSKCTPLLPKHIYVLWWWLVLNRSNKPLPPLGTLRWWVKTGWMLAGKLFTLPGSLGEDFVLTFVYVTERSWKSLFPLKDNVAITNSYFPSHLTHEAGKCSYCLHCYRNCITVEQKWLIWFWAKGTYNSQQLEISQEWCHYC